MKTYCLALDLKDDDEAIAQYERHHRHVWKEVEQSLKDVGVVDMKIFRFANRLFMIMQTDDSFSFERKAEVESKNPKVKEWEDLMSNYQQPLPGTIPPQKWQLMELIYHLSTVK